MTMAENTLLQLAAHHREFIGFVAKRVGDRDVAEDLLQSAFLKASERQDQLRDEVSSVAWFYRLLRNAMIDYYRRQDVERRGAERGSINDLIGEPDDLAREVACQCVLSLLPSIKPEYGDILRKVDVEEKDLGEVAAELGVAPGNARVRLHRARAALRTRVEETCRTCAEHACHDCTCRSAKGAESRGL